MLNWQIVVLWLRKLLEVTEERRLEVSELRVKRALSPWKIFHFDGANR